MGANAIKVINVGAAPNDGTGDTHRDSFTKANENFALLQEEVLKKADADTVKEALDKKADDQAIRDELANKADSQTMTEALAKKADAEEVKNALGGKADTQAVKSAFEEVGQGLSAIDGVLTDHEKKINALEQGSVSPSSIAGAGLKSDAENKKLEVQVGTGVLIKEGAVSVDIATSEEIVTGEAEKIVDAQGLISYASENLVKSSDYDTKLHTDNGYQKLPNGLIIQWGTTGAVSTGATADFVFPISFVSEALTIVTGRLGSSTSANGNYVAEKAGNLSKSGFSLFVDGTSPGTSSLVCRYIAIGY